MVWDTLDGTQTSSPAGRWTATAACGSWSPAIWPGEVKSHLMTQAIHSLFPKTSWNHYMYTWSLPFSTSGYCHQSIGPCPKFGKSKDPHILSNLSLLDFFLADFFYFNPLMSLIKICSSFFTVVFVSIMFLDILFSTGMESGSYKKWSCFPIFRKIRKWFNFILF